MRVPKRPAPDRGRWLEPRRVLFLLGSAWLLVLFGAEGYLRATIHPPADPAHFQFLHPPLARLEVSVTHSMVGLSARQTLFTTSSLGVRGDEVDLADRRVLKILTLGDSVTECLLLSNADAWPRRLQDALQERTGRPTWVGNGALSGQMALDYIAHLHEVVPRIQPDILVIMPGGYELQAAVEEKLVPMDLEDPGKLAQYTEKLYSGANLDGLEPSYLKFVLERWANAEQLDMTPFYDRMRARRAAASELHDEVPDLEEAIDIYVASLRGMLKAWRKLSPRPELVLLTRPFLWREQMSNQEQQALWGGYTCMECDDPEYYATGALAVALRRFNQVLMTLCAEERLNCLDLEGMIEKNLDNFYDDAHMKEAGALKTAGHIADFLTARELAP